MRKPLAKEDAARFVALAAHYVQQEDLSAAEGAAEAALACDRDNPDAIAAMGAVFARKREFGKAATHFERALKFRPDDVANWTSLGECYMSTVRVADAVNAFRKAMELDPKSDHPAGRRARVVVAKTLMKLQKEAKAGG